MDALVTATRNTRLAELRQILGTEGRALIWSGDRVADRVGRDKFIVAYDHGHRLEMTGSTRAVLIVGPEQWPFPIPLVRDATGWHFDTPAGVQEILNRRVGRNELNVIEVCRAFVVAQREYAERDPMGTGLAEFAQNFLSTPGTRDGLYWPTQPGEEDSPLGPLVASARAEGLPSARRSLRPFPTMATTIGCSRVREPTPPEARATTSWTATCGEASRWWRSPRSTATPAS